MVLRLDMDPDKQNSSVFIDLSAFELASFIKCLLCFRAGIHYCFLVRRTEQDDRGQIWPSKERERDRYRETRRNIKRKRESVRKTLKAYPNQV